MEFPNYTETTNQSSTCLVTESRLLDGSRAVGMVPMDLRCHFGVKNRSALRCHAFFWDDKDITKALWPYGRMAVCLYTQTHIYTHTYLYTNRYTYTCILMYAKK